MNPNATIPDVIKEFFEEQYKNGLSQRFADSLTEDFNDIMRDFNDFIVRKHLGLNEFKLGFHDVVNIMTNEICGFKSKAIKVHADMLLRSAQEAKALDALQKGIITH